jgi:AAA ATPase domain
MWPIDRPPHWVGRTPELAVLRAGAEALRRGEGAVVWVEGEPGIGKSSLVAEALAEAGDPGWDIGWGVADQAGRTLSAKRCARASRSNGDRPGSAGA